MANGAQKPDTSRQSKAFDEVQAGLTVEQIAVPLGELRVFCETDRVSRVRAENVKPVYDHLPVVDPVDGERVVGLLASEAVEASSGGEDPSVGDRMEPLSEANLVDARMRIVDLIGRIRREPFLLKSGQGITGMVTWSDLQELPVRAALFALVTGLELTMYEAIKRRFEESEDWIRALSPGRRCRARVEHCERIEGGGDVDLLLCTQFCDKRDILVKFKAESFDFSIGKERLRKKFRAIEALRDPLAHASNYCMSFEEVEKLRDTVGDIRELRQELESMPTDANH